ncbi:DUF2306 domain-containing protein [Brevibacillus fluminis]|uniref:DUF2306 domain-containing protein n=1 Tax=Brevibacillus fluminis TaxID=511487 RepID=UPI003F8C48A8
MRKHFYALMLAVAAVFIGYSFYANFIHDPQATGFLGHKVALKRPINLPVWLTVMEVHIVFACVALVSGALNFPSRIVQNYRKFHKFNGYLYVASVVIVDLTSGYMAPFSTGGKINSVAFNLLNIIWLGMTIAAIAQIKRKQIDKHRKWMVRSYAFCYTNMFIHLITYVCHNGFGMAYETSYTIGVYGTILLLLVIAEIVLGTIYRHPKGRLRA